MVVSEPATDVDESLFFLSLLSMVFAICSSDLVLISPFGDGDMELSELGPVCSKSSLHGFALCSNSRLSVAYPRSTCMMDEEEEEEE